MNQKQGKPKNIVVFESNGIKNLDIMGERFKLHYTKSVKQFRTRVGGCSTILVVILSLAALVLIFSQYFDTSSPIVTTVHELSRSAQSINIYGKDLFPGITVAFMNVFEPLKMNNFITIQGQVVKKTFNPATNKTEIDLSKKYSYIPCSEVDQSEPVVAFQRSLADAHLSILLCPHFREVDNEVIISSDPENLSSAYLSLKVYPCSLPDKNECFPMQKVFGAEISITDMSNLLSPSNYDDPVAIRWVGKRFLIDITRTKSFRYGLQQNKVIDDRSFLKKPEVKADYDLFRQFTTDTWARDMTQLYCSSEMIDSGEFEEYFEFVYEMDNEIVVTTRRYKKIPSLVGEFGGVLKVLTTAFVILSLYYSTAVKSFLFEKAFKIDKSTFQGLKKESKLTKMRHLSPG